ncbi:hypothetical protein GGR50DRAFT_406802 [Xylaria sp. CBS 124048]|nr:hypothetical protein GGR50DRAFT_406802 [Xylaria sp. CBS 124048]
MGWDVMRFTGFSFSFFLFLQLWETLRSGLKGGGGKGKKGLTNLFSIFFFFFLKKNPHLRSNRSTIKSDSLLYHKKKQPKNKHGGKHFMGNFLTFTLRGKEKKKKKKGKKKKKLSHTHNLSKNGRSCFIFGKGGGFFKPKKKKFFSSFRLSFRLGFLKVHCAITYLPTCLPT